MSFEAGAFGFVILALLKVTLVALVAAVCTRLLARSKAASRHAVWATALIVMLWLPLLSLGKTKVGFDVPSRFLRAASGPSASDLGSDQGARVQVDASLPAPVANEEVSGSRSSFGLAFSDLSSVAGIASWKIALLSVYLIGMLILLARFLSGFRRASALRQSAMPARAHRDWSDTFNQLQTDFPGLREFREQDTATTTGLYASPELVSPATFGLLRPTFCLPHSNLWTRNRVVP